MIVARTYVPYIKLSWTHLVCSVGCRVKMKGSYSSLQFRIFGGLSAGLATCLMNQQTLPFGFNFYLLCEEVKSVPPVCIKLQAHVRHTEVIRSTSEELFIYPLTLNVSACCRHINTQSAWIGFTVFLHEICKILVQTLN